MGIPWRVLPFDPNSKPLSWVELLSVLTGTETRVQGDEVFPKPSKGQSKVCNGALQRLNWWLNRGAGQAEPSQEGMGKLQEESLAEKRQQGSIGGRGEGGGWVCGRRPGWFVFTRPRGVLSLCVLQVQ